MSNGLKHKKIFLIIFLMFYISLPVIFYSYAADKNWVGAGDVSTWADAKNWFPDTVPTSADNVTIDLKAANVTAARTFEAKSLYVGGASNSTFSTNDFIYGNLIPDSSSDNALYIRKDGTVVLTGQGIIKLKGTFKNSEEALSGQESFMFQLY